MDWFVVFFAAALLSVFSAGIYRKFNLSRKIVVGIDINKPKQPKVCESAGMALLPVFILLGAYLYINGIWEAFPWVLLVGIFGIVGFMDDTRQKFFSKPVPWGIRAGIIGAVSFVFASLYAEPLLMAAPMALYIAVLASFENTFAGLNGWEVGSGFIISLAVAYSFIGSWLAPLAFMLSGAILGLLLWNKYPAKAFPGDSGTLAIGGGIATLLVIQANLQMIIMGAMFFLPHMLDLLLKVLTNTGDMSQARQRPYKLDGEGRIAIPGYKDGKTRYDFAKLIVRIAGPMKEWKLVAVIWAVVLINCLFVLALFGKL